MVAELVTIVAWGEGIPARFEDQPQFSWHVPEQVRRVRAPVPLRLDEADGLHLLGDGIVHLDAGGAEQGRTPLSGPVADYACDAAGTCILLADGRLRALNRAGNERWAVAGGFTQVLSAGDRVYAQALDGLAELDGRSGALRRTLPQRSGSGPAFLGGGRAVSVVYDEQRERRGVLALDPDGEAAELTGGAELYPWLVYPFGADGRARLYVWRAGRVARVSLDGEIDVLGAVDGIAVRGDDVFTSRHEGDEVVVSGPDGDTRLPAPPGFRLINVGSTGDFHLLGGEAPGDAGALRVHASDGRLRSVDPPPEDLAAIDCRVPVHTAWQVDSQGRVAIPVVTPAGVAVVRLRKR